jgi:hypothetical protein
MLSLGVLMLVARTGSAQTFDISGGYAWLRETDLTWPKGFYIAARGNLNDSFGIFGQLSQHTKTLNISGVDVSARLRIFGAGPRITGNQRSGVTYFAQLLLGGAQATSEVPSISSVSVSRTHFAIQPAGGVDVKAGGTVGVRFQVGETFIRAEGEAQKELTLFVGVVIRGG